MVVQNVESKMTEVPEWDLEYIQICKCDAAPEKIRAGGLICPRCSTFWQQQAKPPDDGFDYGRLDDGIRETVRLLRGCGFNTTDSGDGSKAGKMECALGHPMIAIRVDNPEHLPMHARRLYRILTMGHDVKWGKNFYQGKDSAPWLEANYSPIDSVSMIILTNVNDEVMGLKK